MSLAICCKERAAQQVIVIVALVAAFQACESKRPEVYEIPNGYRGWIEIRAKRPGCPPLRQTSDQTIFVVPPSGILCTSSSVAFGWSREDYYYVSGKIRLPLVAVPHDQRSMIWSKEYHGSDGSGPRHEAQRDRIRFFVGTRREYQATLAHGGG